MARWHESILPLLLAADLHVALPPLSPEQARSRMERGIPLLRGLELELDVHAARELMIRLARAMETLKPGDRAAMDAEPGSGAGDVRRALEEGRLDPGTLVAAVAAGERGSVAAMARAVRLDPDLVWTLASNTLKPALRAWQRQVSPLIEGTAWHQGYCPTCGAPAALGELRGDNLARHLRCGECGADWRFPRLRCFTCGNEDHATQRYLYAESDRMKGRVEVCDRCRGYLKVITTFSPTPVEMLPVEDLATLHLDRIAREHGYARVTVMREQVAQPDSRVDPHVLDSPHNPTEGRSHVSS